MKGSKMMMFDYSRWDSSNYGGFSHLIFANVFGDRPAIDGHEKLGSEVFNMLEPWESIGWVPKLQKNKTPFLRSHVSFVELGGFSSTPKRAAGSREWQPINGGLRKQFDRTFWPKVLYRFIMIYQWISCGKKKPSKAQGCASYLTSCFGALPKVKNFRELCGLLKAWSGGSLDLRWGPQSMQGGVFPQL